MKLKERRMMKLPFPGTFLYHLGAPASIRTHITKFRMSRSAASLVLSAAQTLDGLGDHGGGGAALVLPGWGQNAGQLVVPGQAVDPTLNQNEPELGIPVLPVPLKMLPDGDGLLDQVVAILGQLRSHALALQDAQDLVASNETNLGNTVGIPEDDTDLGGGQTLLGKLEDLVLHLVAGDLEPLGNGPPVGKSGLDDALSRCVHATHPAFLRPSLLRSVIKLESL